ncbi:glycosyltransferase family 4 protein [Candidatus Wolfebacteria bacterium]|nr:glycosyltransferase family 4 protein [Candidatus Wolfebacteria bacterium]
MRVAIVTSYDSRKPAGLERVFLEQVRALDKINGQQNVEYVIYTGPASDLAEVFQRESINKIPVIKLRGGRLWKEIGLFFAPKADAYFFNGPLVPLFFIPKNYFVLVYDFAYRYFTDSSLKQKIKNKWTDFISSLAFSRAKKIVAISDATKEDICSLFNVSKDKITTIYLGLNKMNILESEPVADISPPYFLFIGTLKERKNVLNVVKSYALFKKRTTHPHRLVIIGKRGNGSAYINKIDKVINDENLLNSVLFTDHISDKQVSDLYKNAAALVFPTLLEGFGMPPLEAMSCDVPVITSNVSSLGEVAGDAALLVDPNDIEQIAVNMRKLVEDHSLVVDLIKKGRERIKLFSWDDSALKYNKLFMEEI